jgi:hypothetical protein
MPTSQGKPVKLLELSITKMGPWPEYIAYILNLSIVLSLVDSTL